jgi:hypothetical protein
MATEALMALEFDNNAIGWYDEKLSQAKKYCILIEPSVFEPERTKQRSITHSLSHRMEQRSWITSHMRFGISVSG